MLIGASIGLTVIVCIILTGTIVGHIFVACHICFFFIRVGEIVILSAMTYPISDYAKKEKPNPIDLPTASSSQNSPNRQSVEVVSPPQVNATQ